MKAGKSYSKSTRKKSIDSEKDPYLLKAAPGDMAECKKCSIIYHDKRWYPAGELVRLKTADKKVEKVLCPACQKIKDKFVGGFVNLSGEFLGEHKDEILKLLKNKEARAMRHNPLDRIIEVKERTGGLEVTTTTEKLAQRFGQILKKTFGGEVEYKWSSGVKLARVNWNR